MEEAAATIPPAPTSSDDFVIKSFMPTRGGDDDEPNEIRSAFVRGVHGALFTCSNDLRLVLPHECCSCTLLLPSDLTGEEMKEVGIDEDDVKVVAVTGTTC